MCEQLEYSANLQKESKEVLYKISLHQKNKQISGGKRFVFTLGAVISAIWTAVKIGMAVYTVVDLAKTVVEEVVLPLLQDEKGLLIIKSRLPLSKYFIFQVWQVMMKGMYVSILLWIMDILWKKSKIFGPNLAKKYALAITVKLCLGCNSRLCPATWSLIRLLITHRIYIGKPSEEEQEIDKKMSVRANFFF